MIGNALCRTFIFGQAIHKKLSIWSTAVGSAVHFSTNTFLEGPVSICIAQKTMHLSQQPVSTAFKIIAFVIACIIDTSSFFIWFAT
jgi:hypothetical protein